MAVAATRKDDHRAGFSQRGKWLSVAAPGGNILSTVPGGYERYSGTSMASPNVAGLSALLARQGRPNQVIRARIQRTAEDLGPDGKDVHYGYGRVDAARATLR
jgi:subtilisin family serine protease